MDSIETNVDGIRTRTELEAEDSLAVRLKRIQLEGPAPRQAVRAVLEKQTRTILDQVNYLDGELGLIEIDGVSNAVQIRTKKPAPGRFVEVILRGGNSISVEARGAAVHVSRENFEKLNQTLRELL